MGFPARRKRWLMIEQYRQMHESLERDFGALFTVWGG
jgi:hypothetical protein